MACADADANAAVADDDDAVTLEHKKHAMKKACLDAVRRGILDDLRLALEPEDNRAVLKALDAPSLFKRLLCDAALYGRADIAQYLCHVFYTHFDTVTQLALRHTFSYACVLARQRGHARVAQVIRNSSSSGGVPSFSNRH